MSVETSTDNHGWLCSEINIFEFRSSEQQNSMSTVFTVDTAQYRGIQIKGTKLDKSFLAYSPAYH